MLFKIFAQVWLWVGSGGQPVANTQGKFPDRNPNHDTNDESNDSIDDDSLAGDADDAVFEGLMDTNELMENLSSEHDLGDKSRFMKKKDEGNLTNDYTEQYN